MITANTLRSAKRTMRTLLAATVLATGLVAGLLTTGLIATAGATESRLPRIHTNQQFLEDIALSNTVKLDAISVFGMVLDSLPDRVTVYPTENYYYFKFNYAGRQYSGNIRLENERRDKGQVHFAFAPEYSEWKTEVPAVFKVLTKADGVTIEKINDLSYRVSHGAKTVVFDLNDLRHVKPPADAMSRDERFIGPIFDESGVRFLLVYNQKLKAFHYLLDETITPNESFTPSPSTDRILIGKRTGFAFYRDHKLDRKILIGVFEGNSRVNNYYDGPFDQLPDNFIEGNSLRDAILDVAPQLKGRIDRYGSSFDGETRYMVAPYTHYATEDDLLMFHDCATSKTVPADQYHLCFVYDDSEDDARNAPAPQATPAPPAPPASKKASIKK
ncbi:MAG: hypothetical protein K2Y71_24715 [Xanthobacteraceae bacterium]|nr:hypothetical protein [Xanthobacteraceae bacterium]